MRRIFYIITTLIILSSCSSSKNFLSKKDEDKALQNAIKALDKKRHSKEAEEAIPVLYAAIQQKNLAIINSLRGQTDINRFDRIHDAYNRLQQAYESITNHSYASSLIMPVNYSNEITALEQEAAEAYYIKASEYLNLTGRDNAKMAYKYFDRSRQWISNYKDAKIKMNEAYDKAVVNVVINPVTTTYFYNSGWSYQYNNYSGQNFQQCLIRDLGGSYSSRYPARFFTDWEANRTNMQMDWVVDLSLRDIDIPRPYETSQSRTVTKQVEMGRDTAGRIIYQTVSARITTIRRSFTARARMDVSINDVAAKRNISYNSFNENYSWQTEFATYTGDQRAISDEDWRLINSLNSYEPGRDEVMNELYSRLYPRVKNEIAYRVDW